MVEWTWLGHTGKCGRIWSSEGRLELEAPAYRQVDEVINHESAIRDVFAVVLA